MINITDILNTVLHADCVDIMRELPDKCIDLVLTDPPYGINIGTSTGGASRLVTVGGEKLSRPKFTGRLTTAERPMENILTK